MLESELTALRLVRYALEQGIDLPAHYCSFPYKRRFQHAAARRRGIPFVRESGEEVTQAGYLRVVGAGTVQYFEAVTLPAEVYRHSVVEIPLPTGGRIAVEKRPVSRPMPAGASLFAGVSPETVFSAELLRFKRIPTGLADYF